MLRAARRMVGSALDRRIHAVNARVEAVGDQVTALSEQLAASTAELAALRAEQEQTRGALRWLAQDHAEHRRLLRAARALPSYTEVFDDPDPLVSVVIPTLDQTDLLLTRSLPSVLAQTHERLEVIVVG